MRQHCDQCYHESCVTTEGEPATNHERCHHATQCVTTESEPAANNEYYHHTDHATQCVTTEGEPATTLWELWNGDEAGPSMNSRNHIMFGGNGTVLFPL
jgi:hypothetical protein